MNYYFEPISFSREIAYHLIDSTIRYRSADSVIPGLSINWNVSHTTGQTIRPEHWDSSKGCIVYDTPYYQTNYSGMSQSERDVLTPKVVSGLAAELVRNAVLVRGTWRFGKDIETITNLYLAKANQGYEFTEKEMEQHQREESLRWINERESLRPHIPTELFDAIHKEIEVYCGTNQEDTANAVGLDDKDFPCPEELKNKLLSCLKDRDKGFFDSHWKKIIHAQNLNQLKDALPVRFLSKKKKQFVEELYNHGDLIIAIKEVKDVGKNLADVYSQLH